MIIDSSYFTGPLTIAQIGQLEVEEKLNDYIEQYEVEFLNKVLGYGLSKSFIEGVDVGSDETMEGKWSDLLNGVEFSRYGVLNKFDGVETNIARYVFWHYVNDLHLQQTGIGTVKTKGQGSTPATPMFKMIKAWNEMVESVNVLWQFLELNTTVYTDYNRSGVDKKYFRHQNQFGI